MNEREQAALDFIQHQIQSLDMIHKEALNALNAVQGNERVQKWKKQVVAAITEHISEEQGKRLSKDWLETSYVAGDLFDELSDDVDMCRRHLKRVAKEIQANGLSSE